MIEGRAIPGCPAAKSSGVSFGARREPADRLTASSGCGRSSVLKPSPTERLRNFSIQGYLFDKGSNGALFFQGCRNDYHPGGMQGLS